MKKILPTLIVLLAFGAGGAAVYLFQKQARGAASGESVDEYLPGDTQLLLAVPDLGATVSNWKSTDLYKIWAEPEVQNFLAKPLSKLPPHKEFDDTVEKILNLSPTNLFVAVTAMDEKTNQPHFVAGFDFKGDKSEVDELLAGAKDEFRKKSPAGKAELTNYEGFAVETFDAGEGNTLASTYLDHRYLISNDLALLKATVDRCGHRPAAGNTLAKESDFKTVLAKLPGQHETLIFARPQAMLHRLFDLSAAAGQSVGDTRRAELEKVKAVGATTKIESGKLRDTFYYLAPGLNQVSAKLQMSSLRLTSPDTLFYAASMFDLPAKVDLPEGPLPAGTPLSGLLTGLRELAVMLRDHGLTLDRFRAAFGNETSVHVDWPADQTQPSLITSVDVRDRALAGKFVDDLSNTLAAEGAWQVSQDDGLQFYTLISPNISFVSPTLTLTDKHLVFGLNPPEVRGVARRERSGGSNFTGSEPYKRASAMVADPNVAFAYVDTPALFERVYGLVRGVALFGASLVYPQLGEYVNLAKLPSSEAISKHLSPTIFSQKIDDQGGLLESVGSVTVGEAAFVLLGGTGAAAIPIAQSHLGAAAKGPADNLSPTPGTAAAPPPESSPSQPGGGQ